MRTRTMMALLMLAGAAALARRLARSATTTAGTDQADSSRPADASPPTSVALARTGSPSDRGLGGTITMDLDRARAHHVEPVVEFLTYVQSQRGERSHLMFVRTDDLDAMAASVDEPAGDFLDRLDQLGVVVSHN